jgi:predicted nuclease of predicted toxin-antitoxin system
MRLLVDECAGPHLAAWLRQQGHEVFSVYDEARGSSDDDLLKKAVDENWVLVTLDRDFSERIFRDGMPHRGIVFLRLNDQRSGNKIAVMQRLLEAYPDRLTDQFVVVSETSVRIAGER